MGILQSNPKSTLHYMFKVQIFWVHKFPIDQVNDMLCPTTCICSAGFIIYLVINPKDKLTIVICVGFHLNIRNHFSSWVRKSKFLNIVSVTKVKPNLSRYITSISFVPIDPIIKIIEDYKWLDAICNQKCLKSIYLEHVM